MAGVDAATQAENRKALDHAVANLNKVLKAGGVGAEHGLERVAVILTSAVKVKLSQPGTGRVYPARRSKGQNRTADHRASAPGSPPAVDTGKYRASWDWRKGRDSHGPYVEIGTNDKRGCVFGGRSLVSSDRGAIAIGRIRVGDRVLTQTGEWREVLATSAFPAVEKPDLVDLTIQSGPTRRGHLTLTVDHPVLVHRTGRNLWVPAGDVCLDDQVFGRRNSSWTKKPWKCVNCGGGRKGAHQGVRQQFCTIECRSEYWTRTATNPHLGSKRTAEARQRMSQAARKRLAEHPELHPSRIVAQRGYETDVERQVAEWLTERGLDFERQVRFGSHLVDFYVPSLDEAIEADGAYWHQDQAKDIQRDSDLRNVRSSLTITHVHFHDHRFSPVMDPEPLPGVRYVVCNPGTKSYVEPDTTTMRPVVGVRHWVYGTEPHSGYGANHYRAKLTQAQAVEIRDRYQAGGVLQRELAEEYGVSRPQVSALINGLSYAPVSHEARTAKLYDLTVEGVHSFFANGILVSNSWLEFGTSRMAARPHIRPTVEETAATMTRTIAERVVSSQVQVLNRLGKIVK